MSDEPNLNHNHEPSLSSEAEQQPVRQALMILQHFLEEDEWYPQAVAGRDTFRMPYQGRNGSFQCYAQVRVEAEQLICYAIAPLKVAEPYRAAVGEFVNRANYGLYIANFELDYSDGEVRCKSSIDFEGETLTNNLIRNTIYPAVRLMDQYLPSLLKVALGASDPVTAITEAEA